jgi:glutaredoxin
MTTQKKIEIYSTPTCHFCHMEKEFLAGHNIPFVDYNVAEDMEKRRQMVELTGQMGVPVTVITDPANPHQPDIIVGFSQALFEEKLGLHEENITKLAV